MQKIFFLGQFYFFTRKKMIFDLFSDFLRPGVLLKVIKFAFYDVCLCKIFSSVVAKFGHIGPGGLRALPVVADGSESGHSATFFLFLYLCAFWDTPEGEIFPPPHILA